MNAKKNLLKIKLSLRAKEDFRAIYDYSLEMFGENHAVQYTTKIQNRINILTEFPEIGQHHKDLPKNIAIL
jgi:plasmid stabilization system protein ParE